MRCDNKMKKLFLLFLVIISVVLILIFNNANELKVVKDSSYFSDFYVEGNKVYIKCEITIKNSSYDDKVVKLNAILKDDVELGLLKEENLAGFNTGLICDEFTIEKKSEKNYSVIFVGDFAGTYKKHDRKLPEIVISVVK